jgi:hypothetical protein
MLLRRSPHTFWASGAIAERLSLNSDLVNARLEFMREKGIVTIGDETGAYRYAPRDAASARVASELAAECEERQRGQRSDAGEDLRSR